MDRLLFSTDPNIRKMFTIPDQLTNNKRKEDKKRKKQELKQSGYPELDSICQYKVSDSDKVLYSPIDWFDHLCHHIRIEKQKDHYSIICVTCGHDINHNHDGIEIGNLYPNDDKFYKIFERKATKNKRYSYYSCTTCGVQISFIKGSDKWTIRKCPICESKKIVKHRDIEVYDHDIVTKQNYCKKLHIQLIGFTKYCKSEFKKAKYIYNYKTGKSNKQKRVKDPYIDITKKQESQSITKGRIIVMLRDEYKQKLL